jgi:hypothetical protein
MSYTIMLVKDGEPCKVPGPPQGGILNIATDSPTAAMNVTYNYKPIIEEQLDIGRGNLKDLDGRIAEDTLPHLAKAVLALGTAQSTDYWECTPGNVGFMLHVLLCWGAIHPHATWKVF